MLAVNVLVMYAHCRCLRSLAEPMSCWTFLWMRTACRDSSVMTRHRMITPKPRWAPAFKANVVARNWSQKPCVASSDMAGCVLSKETA